MCQATKKDWWKAANAYVAGDGTEKHRLNQLDAVVTGGFIASGTTVSM